MIKSFSLSFSLICAFSLADLAHTANLLATEIRLKATCQSSGSLLVLGDVAEIYATDADEAERLAKTPLTPAPAPGTKRFLRGREIQDMLVGRGVNVGELSFSGANQVAVETVLVSTPSEPKPAQRESIVPPLQIVNEALVNYLTDVTRSEQARKLEFQLTTTTQQALRNASGNITITGGEAPWSGSQHFMLHIPTAAGDVQHPLNVEVTVQQAVVAVVRSLPRGSILRAEDLQLVEPASHEHVVRVEETFHELEQVIGKETQRAISPGQVLDKNYVRSQILVRRGDVVTVYARAAGIRVRTTARALSDGSVGELVAVETLETGSRDKFDARVTGAQAVEVWAGSIASGK